MVGNPFAGKGLGNNGRCLILGDNYASSENRQELSECHISVNRDTPTKSEAVDVASADWLTLQLRSVLTTSAGARTRLKSCNTDPVTVNRCLPALSRLLLAPNPR